ncbi:MAG: response regulator [Pirellulaceae bacterium]
MNETVYIVQNDSSVSHQVATLLISRGRAAKVLESAEALLERVTSRVSPDPQCLVCDIQLPLLGGLALMTELRKRRVYLPTVFYTERPNLVDAVKAIRLGALDVIERSSDHERLIQSVGDALNHYRSTWQMEQRRRSTLERLRSLSDGEQQVLDGILRGMLNKEIASTLQLSIRTVEQRRRQIFRKLDVQHPAALAQRVVEATNSSWEDTIQDQQQPLGTNFFFLAIPSVSPMPQLV